MSSVPAPRIAVVILNWNGKKFLERFLGDVVRRSTPLARVIVADNASTDGSMDFLADRFPEVEVIRMPENTGFTGGYNRALELVDAEYFVLLNSDIEVAEGWLEPLLEHMDRHPSAAACQPKILDYNNRNKFEYAGAAGGYIDRLGYPYCRGRIFDRTESDHGQYDDVREVFWATGAAMMVRSRCYREAGGLDKRFFAHMEEIDLCWKFRRLGYSVFIVPASVVYHIGGGTLSKSNPRKTYLNFRNNLLMLFNNLDRKEFGKIYRRRIFWDVLAALRFLAGSGAADFKAVLKAHLDFRKLRKEDSGFSTKCPKSAAMNSFKGGGISVLFQYYLRGKKSFSELEPVRGF
jgi:GT2 family glycosyltransferase